MKRIVMVCAIAGLAVSGRGDGVAQAFARPPALNEEAKPWQAYLVRCQVLLNAGESVAEGLTPDFSCGGAGFSRIRRQTGDADIYIVNNPAFTNVSAECLFRVTGKVPEFWNAADGTINPAPVFQDVEGQTRLPLRVGPAGCAFVVFRPGESKRHATRLVFTPSEGEQPPTCANPAYEVKMEKRGPLLLAWTPGTFDITLADGRAVKKQVYEVPAPFVVDGARDLAGALAYEKTVLVPDDLMGPGRRMMLDLGDVRDVAAVTLNSRELGVLWRPPYVVDVTYLLKVGENALRIKVTTRHVDGPAGADRLPSKSALLGPVCIRTVFELPGR